MVSFLWSTVNKNVDWINYICYDPQRFVNYSRDALRGAAEQLDATSKMAWGKLTGLRHDSGERSGTPVQYSCLENPMDGGAWWAAVSVVAQNGTQLKGLSSSNSAALLCNSLFLLINWYRVKGLATKIILKLLFKV